MFNPKSTPERVNSQKTLKDIIREAYLEVNRFFAVETPEKYKF